MLVTASGEWRLLTGPPGSGSAPEKPEFFQARPARCVPDALSPPVPSSMTPINLAGIRAHLISVSKSSMAAQVDEIQLIQMR